MTMAQTPFLWTVCADRRIGPWRRRIVEDDSRSAPQNYRICFMRIHVIGTHEV